jgi:hypothetical protein
MADFCNKCARDLQFEEGDLANLGDGRKLEEGYGWQALCENCGPILVDNFGNNIKLATN